MIDIRPLPGAPNPWLTFSWRSPRIICFTHESCHNSIVRRRVMWVAVRSTMVGEVICKVLITLVAFSPVSRAGLLLHDRQVQRTTTTKPGDDSPLTVFFIFLPPISSIVLPMPYPRNDTFMFIGLDGYVLHVLCERLHRRPIVHTNIDAETLDAMYYGYTRFDEIRENHRRIYTKNEVSVMSSK